MIVSRKLNPVKGRSVTAPGGTWGQPQIRGLSLHVTVPKGGSPDAMSRALRSCKECRDRARAAMRFRWSGIPSARTRPHFPGRALVPLSIHSARETGHVADRSLQKSQSSAAADAPTR